MKKRLLVYAHYFYPDVASTGQILTELCERLQDDFDITVICVVPSYNGKVHGEYKSRRFYWEKHQNIKILRVRVPEFDKRNKLSRVRNILAYFLNAILATFKVGKHNVVFSISQPPILGGVLGVIGKWIKRAKFVYNIQDFNPEQIVAVRYSRNRLVLSLMMWIDMFSCIQADKIIVVGRDMIETLQSRFKGQKRVPAHCYINNWIDERKIYPLDKTDEKVKAFRQKYGLHGKLTFMYSGNIGLYYDLENLIKVIGNFKDVSGVMFAFVGEGSIKDKLVTYKEEHKLDNIVFIPYQDKEDLIYSLNAGDVHLVVNAKGIKGVSVPSKLYGVLAAGKPVLSVLEEGSEGSLIVQESGCGLVAQPGDYATIENMIQKFIDNISSIKEDNYNPVMIMGLKGREFLLNNLSKDLSIKKHRQQITSC